MNARNVLSSLVQDNKKPGRPPREKYGNTIRITADFTEAANNILEKVSGEQHTSKAEIIRRSIGLYDFVHEKKQMGCHIYLESADKKEKYEIVNF